MARQKALLAGLLTLCLAAGACAKAPDPAASGAEPAATVSEGKPRSGGTLSFGTPADANGFNPTASNFLMENYFMASTMLEPLTVFDKDRVPQPFLAESFTPDNLASKWTIKLRPNIRFHDGEPFNAAAVKTNIDTGRKGIPAITLRPIADTIVIDELTLEVDMNQPWASFPAVLASQEGYMEAPNTLLGEHAADQPVGTGPFTFSTWEHGNKLIMKKNPNYWRTDRPYLDQVEFKVLTDPASRANALAAGDVDIMLTNDTRVMADLSNRPDRKVIVDQTGDVEHVIMNQGRPPFDNVNARKALVYATDGQTLANEIGNGFLVPANQPYYEKSAFNTPDPHYGGLNADAARKAVQQYTAETGKPLSFTLTIGADAFNLSQAQILLDNWQKVGINASIDSVEATAMTSRVISGANEATLAANFGFPDPDWNYIFWHSSFVGPIGQLSINMSHMGLESLDGVLAEGRANLLPAKRADAYKQSAQIMNDDFAFVWLYRTAWALIATSRVKGLTRPQEDGFSRTDAKAWWDQVWLDS